MICSMPKYLSADSINAKNDPQGYGHGIQCRNCTLLKAIEDTFQTGTGHINEEHHIVVNGEEHQRKFTLLGSTALINSGDQRHLLLSLLDISELKIAEEQKQDLEKQLFQTKKLESLGVLAGGIAHDFSNILAIIVGNCFLAKMHPDAAEENITTIEKASERAAELCRQMLAYAGKAQYVVAQINMSTLVEEMVKMLKADHFNCECHVERTGIQSYRSIKRGGGAGKVPEERR